MMPDHQGGRPAFGGAGLRGRAGRPLPARPDPLVPQPGGQQVGHRLPGVAVARSGWARAISSGWASGVAARNGAPCPTPTPTSSSRWWARSSAWSAPSSCSACSSPWPGSGSGRPPGRPTGSAACWPWDHHLDHQPGGDQHRRGHRCAAGDRHPPALHLLRGLVARSSPWPPPASSSTSPPRSASAPGAVPPRRRPATAGERGRPTALIASPWWPGGAPPATSSRRWPSPRRWSRPGTPATTIEFVGSTRGQDRQTLWRAGLPAHPAARPGHRPQPGPARPGAGTSVAVVGLAVARWPAPSAWWPGPEPRVVVSVGGYASLAGARWPPWCSGCPWCWSTSTPSRARPTGSRPLRPGQRRRMGGDAAAPIGGDRDAGAPGDRRRRPRAQGAERARRDLGLPEDRATVVVFGGSLGARRINEAVAGLVDRWHDRGDRADLPRRRPAGLGGPAGSATEPQPHRRPEPHRGAGPGIAVARVPYEERMDCVYAAADLVVCRAGAMTVAELAAAGVPVGAGSAARRARRPPDRQRPGARSGRSRPRPARRPMRRPTLAALLDRLLADPPGSRPWGGRRPPWAARTPPPPGRGWSRPMPRPTGGRPRRRW